MAGANQSAGKDKYNEAFERLVQTSDDIEGFIAYGLYKQAKREWILKFKDENGSAPKPADERAFAASWTETSLQSLREAAESALSAYAQSVVRDETPSIERDALMLGRPLWRDVVIGVVSAFSYSIIIIIAAFILNTFGNDFLDAAKALGVEGSTAPLSETRSAGRPAQQSPSTPPPSLPPPGRPAG